MSKAGALILKLMSETKLPRPNAGQSWLELGRQLNDDLFVCGSCLAWAVPSKMGATMEVHRIDPKHAVPQPRTDQYPEGFWRVTGGMHGDAVLPAESVHRAYGHNPLLVYGDAP